MEKYILNKSLITDEQGVTHETYGITCGERIITDISTNKQSIESLIKKANKTGLSPIHLDDVIEDFLVDFKI